MKAREGNAASLLNLGTWWRWRLSWRLRTLQFLGKGPRLKLKREVDSTRVGANPSETRNIYWASTELKVDWSISHPVAWTVYRLGNRSCNLRYGQTKLNHKVEVSFDIIPGEEVEMKLVSYNSILLEWAVGYVYLRSSCTNSIFRHFRNIASRLSVCPSVSMVQLTSHWTEFDEIWYSSIFKKSVEKI